MVYVQSIYVVLGCWGRVGPWLVSFEWVGGEGRRGLGRLVRLLDVLWEESDFEIGEGGG